MRRIEDLSAYEAAVLEDFVADAEALVEKAGDICADDGVVGDARRFISAAAGMVERSVRRSRPGSSRAPTVTDVAPARFAAAVSMRR